MTPSILNPQMPINLLLSYPYYSRNQAAWWGILLIRYPQTSIYTKRKYKYKYSHRNDTVKPKYILPLINSKAVGCGEKNILVVHRVLGV